MSAAPAALAAALALAQAATPAVPTRPAPQVPIRVEAAADGSPVAFRDGDATPLRGVDIYRAVLRLDLVERHDRALTLRRALLAGSAVALVAGPALGYAMGSAAARPTVNCWVMGPDGQPIPECRPSAAIERENQVTLRQRVLAGTAIGVGLSAALLAGGLAVHPPVPDLAEARALAERFNGRLPAAAPPPRGEPRRATSAGLRLAPLDRGGWVGLAGSF